MEGEARIIQSFRRFSIKFDLGREYSQRNCFIDPGGEKCDLFVAIELGEVCFTGRSHALANEKGAVICYSRSTKQYCIHIHYIINVLLTVSIHYINNVLLTVSKHYIINVLHSYTLYN